MLNLRERNKFFKNILPIDIEQGQELINTLQNGLAHIAQLLKTIPKELEGNTFYTAIWELIYNKVDMK